MSDGTNGESGTDATGNSGEGTATSVDPEAVAADFEAVGVETGDPEGVAVVTIDRPEARNALNGTVREELSAAITACGDADEVLAVVLAGSEESGAFVAGADVTELRERGVLEQRAASERPRVYETVADCACPVIAAVNGHALGGGCELAQACDVRIAEDGAKLGQPEITLGLMPGGGGTQRLPRLVGTGQAAKMVLTGELLSTEEAEEVGLVEEVVDDALERARELAVEMADQSPVALELALESLRASERMPLDEGLEHESQLFVQLFASHDKDEGIDAFLEDREPEWEGR